MNQDIPDIVAVNAAMEEGRYADALRFLLDLFGRAERDNGSSAVFFAMFLWGELAAAHPPARAALAHARDEQTRRLLAGEILANRAPDEWPRSRFQLIVDMNDKLEEQGVTYEVFTRLLAEQPELARREAPIAIPAILAAGDYALAERLLPDPLPRLPGLNALAREMPLFPPELKAPRLASELSNFVKDVSLRVLALEGLGRADDAATLRALALKGLGSEELRALAQKEFESPGTITGAIVAHHSSLEAAGLTWGP